MKTNRLRAAGGWAWLLFGLGGGIVPLHAADPDAASPRDALRQVMEPFVDAFSRQPDGPNRALELHTRIVEATAQPPELRGTRLEFLCQTPDRLVCQFCALGTVVTVGRQGQSFWMTPADRLAPLLQQVEQKPPTRADREPFEPLHLRIPTRLFWVLYYLVSVEDAGNAPLGAATCRRLDVHLPESKKGESARLWIKGSNPGQLARVEFISPDSWASLDIEEARLAPSLPASSFEPDATQRANLLPVPAERFRPLLTLLFKQEDERRKQFIHDHGGG